MKRVNREVLLDWWLKKYHNTTVKKVINKYPKEILESPDWFKLYPCTQEQCDEWEKWAKTHIKNTTKMSKKVIDKEWPFIYLECAPYVLKQ